MAETKIKCSSCEAVLKLNGPLPEGKTVKCPKCGEPLRLSAPAKSGVTGKSAPASSRDEEKRRPKPAVRKVEEPPEEPDEELDEDIDERDEEEEAPRKKSSQRRPEGKPKPGKGKRKKSRQDEVGGSKKLLWIGVGGGGVVLAGIIILVIALSGSKNKEKDKSVATTGGSRNPPSLPVDNSQQTPPQAPGPNQTPVSLTTVVGTIDAGLKGVDLGKDEDLTMCLSPDGTVVAVCAKKATETLRLFDVTSGKRLSGDNLGDRDRVPLAISPDKTVIAIGADIGAKVAVELRDLKSGSVAHLLKSTTFPYFTPYHVAFTQAGKSVVAASSNIIVEWDLKSGKEQYAWEFKGNMDRGFAVLPDGNRFVNVGEKVVKVWDVTKKSAIRTIPLNSKRAKKLAVSPDGKVAAVLEDEHGNYLHVRVYDLDSGRKISQLAYETQSGAEKLAFLDARTVVVGGSWNDQVWFFDAATGAERMVVRVNKNVIVGPGEKKGDIGSENNLHDLCVSNGVLAVLLSDGKIKCLRGKK